MTSYQILSDFCSVPRVRVSSCVGGVAEQARAEEFPRGALQYIPQGGQRNGSGAISTAYHAYFVSLFIFSAISVRLVFVFLLSIFLSASLVPNYMCLLALLSCRGRATHESSYRGHRQNHTRKQIDIAERGVESVWTHFRGIVRAGPAVKRVSVQKTRQLLKFPANQLD